MSTEIRIPVADEWHGVSWTWDTRHRPLAFVDVAAAVATAVAEEREACAKIVDEARRWAAYRAENVAMLEFSQLARVIRARGHH